MVSLKVPVGKFGISPNASHEKLTATLADKDNLDNPKEFGRAPVKPAYLARMKPGSQDYNFALHSARDHPSRTPGP